MEGTIYVEDSAPATLVIEVGQNFRGGHAGDLEPLVEMEAKIGRPKEEGEALHLKHADYYGDERLFNWKALDHEAIVDEQGMILDMKNFARAFHHFCHAELEMDPADVKAGVMVVCNEEDEDALKKLFFTSLKIEKA